MPKPKRRRPNIFRIDPTRTVTLRKRFVVEMRRRFAKIRGEIVRLIAIDDAFGILRRITTNKAGDDWRFATSSEQIKAFQEWLVELYGEHLSIQQLMKKFAEDGYKRGIGRAFNDIEKPYGNGKMVYDNLTGDFYTPNRDQFLRSAFGSHIGVERVNQLAARSFTDLKNVTSDMSARMSRTLLEGLVDGSHPNDIAKGLSKDLDISLNRAETIARTEIIRAHAEGQLDAMERMGVAEVGVQVEWVTAGDDAVCPRCGAMEGVVMEIEKAHNLLPLHPGCRCAWLPAGEVLQPRTVADAATEGMALADVENVFCPTGEGGGVDPSCGEGGGMLSKIGSKVRSIGESLGVIAPKTGIRTKVTQTAAEHAAKLFNGKGSVDGIIKMAGATDGATADVSLVKHSSGQMNITVNIDHPDYGALRRVFDDHIENVSFDVKETGKGLGTKIFAQQVAEVIKHPELKYIKTVAARNSRSNGYYTWARLGYDGKVPMGKHGGKMVSELMKTKEGRDWWKEHGQSTPMTFDLTEGSQSRRVLDAYLQERSKRDGAGGATTNNDAGGRGYFGLDLGLDGRVMTLEDVENVFCATGPDGGIDPTCSPGGSGGLPDSKMPAEPSFKSSNATAVGANQDAVKAMKSLASKGDLAALKSHAATPSPKVQQYQKDLVDALEQHKASTPVELPASIAGAKVLKENMGGGSQTPPKLIEKDGQKLVMKVSKNADTLAHIKSEVDADNAYKAAGFAVPTSAMSTYNGKDVKIAEFLEDAKELNEWEKNASYEEVAAVYAEIAKGMAADALFANWDAVGTGKNNIMVKENPLGAPSIFRVDNGGSFKYRAMGELKKDWNYKVTLKSLQDPNKNPNSDVYASVTDGELHGQIKDLLDKKLDIIKAVKDPDTRDILEQRFNHMESQMAALAPAPSPFVDGDSITDLLKGKGDKAHTKLYMKKVAALNPNGIENGTVKVPISFYSPAKGSKEAALAKLHETVKWMSGKLPPGTKVEAVEKYLTAKTLGITKTFGNAGDKFTSTQATTSAQEHAVIPTHLQQHLPTPVAGKVELKSAPNPPKDETWTTKLTATEKSAINSWKGSASDIRKAVSSGQMTPTAKAFMSALEKAPVHEGVVYRGLNGIHADGIAKHIESAGIGGLWSDAAPHCMSPNINTALHFAGGRTLLRIVTKTGRTIWKEDGYSGSGNGVAAEKEVTGMPGTMYKIMAIDKATKNNTTFAGGTLNYMITLMEVGKA